MRSFGSIYSFDDLKEAKLSSFSTVIDEDLQTKFFQYCKDRNLKYSEVIEDLLRDFLNGDDLEAEP